MHRSDGKVDEYEKASASVTPTGTLAVQRVEYDAGHKVTGLPYAFYSATGWIAVIPTKVEVGDA